VRLVIAAAVLYTLPARATVCPAPRDADPSLGQRSGEERLAFLRARSAPDARRAKIWTGSWIGVYGTLTVGSLAATAAVPEEERVDYYVSAATSFVGLMAIAVMPLKAMGDAARIARLESAGGEVCARVKEAERLIARDADGEAFGKGALIHAGSYLLNVAAALTLGIGFGHWEAAALNGLGGILIGEVMIWTQPQGAVDTWEQYRTGRLESPVPRPQLTVVPRLSPTETLLVANVSF
jgi:hypothetical protein